MNRRSGYALHALLVVIAALGTLLLVVSLRVESGNARARAAERRSQALWLARTAVAMRGVTSRDVTLAPGTVARVRVYSFGSGRFAADAVVPGFGAARVEETIASDGRISAVSESWRPAN